MSDLELSICSHCETPTALEDLTHFGEDAEFCPKCAAEWKATFDGCSHDWATIDEHGTPYTDEFGDLGKYCSNCSGFVTAEGPPAMIIPDPTGGETIIGVAVRDEHGTVHIGRRPARHHDLLRLLEDIGTYCPGPDDQGFALADGSFVNRRQAYGVAWGNGQLKPRKPGGYDGPELFSEDLW